MRSYSRKTIPRYVRAKILIRQSNVCNICFCPLQTNINNIPLYDIDHLVRHCETQNDDIDNLQAICLVCHRIKTVCELRDAQVSAQASVQTKTKTKTNANAKTMIDKNMFRSFMYNT
jgi:hypothetical protein